MTLHKKPAVYIITVFIFFIMHIALFAEKPKDAKHAFSYRGMRMSNAGSLSYVTKIETETEQEDMLEIEIKFNIPADPRTLQRKHISLNGQFLPAEALVTFNKSGDKMKILVRDSFLFDGKDKQNHPFYIDLQQAKSFNNVPLYHSHFDDIGRNKKYKFKFLNMPPQRPPKETEEMKMQGDTDYGYVRFEDKN